MDSYHIGNNMKQKHAIIWTSVDQDSKRPLAWLDQNEKKELQPQKYLRKHSTINVGDMI